MVEISGGLVGEVNFGGHPLDCGIKIIILLFFLFITNFESQKTDLPIKSYANCKLCTFKTLIGRLSC
jgi:hypothetical protein